MKRWLHIALLSAWAAAIFIGGMYGVLLLTVYAPTLKAEIRGPVVRDWTVTEWRIEGRDLLMSGNVSKWWPCTYVPPPTAQDEYGYPFAVITSSPEAGRNRAALRRPVRFGEWRIVDGAHRKITLFFEHNCDGQSVVTQLGTLDTTEAP